MTAVARIACVAVPALPLQLVWRQRPEWRGHPVVVVDEDRPQGVVLWACERARSSQVLPGHRYGHALSLCAGLRAQVMPPEMIAAANEQLATALHELSPRVEMGDACWLDGSGLSRVFVDRAGDPLGTQWAEAIAAVVRGQDLVASIVVGFSRFATFAIARAQRRGVRVFTSDADERAATKMVPLARLDIAPKLRDALARLGITTLGEFVRLPGGGILERFGSDAHRLYQLAAGERWDPLVAVKPPETLEERVDFDDDERDLERLMFSLKSALDRLIDQLANRRRAITALHLELVVRQRDGSSAPRTECIAAARPTLDARSLVRLLHLRLDRGWRMELGPGGGVRSAAMWAEEVDASHEQLALFAARPRRDLRAADDAVARVRADLGDDAVVCAVLRDGHLPEASFGWERLAHVKKPETSSVMRSLVRRMYLHPQLMPQQPTSLRDDGWMLGSFEQGPVTRIDGPYIISGQWWATANHREYHFAETKRGDCLWVFFDGNKRRWFLHGAIE